MTEKDHPDFIALLTDAMAYYKQDVSKFTIAVWIEACRPFTMEQVRKAMTAHATDPERGSFAPKVADIIRQLQGTATDRAKIAWGKVYQAMSSVGAYQDVVFDDPAIHAVVMDMGGWSKFCRTETKDLSFAQHQFCEAHKAYTHRGQFEYPRRLHGERSSDDEYRRFGVALPKPALVGQIEQCRLVYSGGVTGGKTAISYEDATDISNVLKRIQ